MNEFTFFRRGQPGEEDSGKEAGSGLTSYALSIKERVVFIPNYVVIKTDLLNCNINAKKSNEGLICQCSHSRPNF